MVSYQTRAKQVVSTPSMKQDHFFVHTVTCKLLLSALMPRSVTGQHFPLLKIVQEQLN